MTDRAGNKLISKTAWFTAYSRSFSDIPYSKEVFREFDKIEGRPETSVDLKSPQLVPGLEARHKLINKVLLESGITQVLEVAAGASPRGLSMAEDKKVQYVELDLPDIIAQKAIIVGRIKKTALPNLHLEGGDALSLNDMKAATGYFDPKRPIAIINEGLMWYFNSEEKMAYAENVRRMLECFGGLWITSDISTLQAIQSQNAMSKTHIAQINEITKTNGYSNSFGSIADAERFFNRLGFSVQIRSFIEVKDQLYSPRLLKIPESEVDEMIRPWVVFAMSGSATPRSKNHNSSVAGRT